MDTDQEILGEFITEGRELIDEVEPMLIELSQGATSSGEIDIEMINAVFRLFHSLKGSAGFLDLKNIASITHEAETVLDMVRSERLSLETELTTLLCRCIDHLLTLFDEVESSGSDSGYADEGAELVVALTGWSTGKHPARPPTAKEPLEEEPLPQPEKVDETAAVEVPTTAPKPTPKATMEETANLAYKFEITPEMTHRFAQEGLELIDRSEQSLLALSENPDNSQDLMDSCFRDVHSLKGNCGFMGLEDMETLSHSCENFLDAIRSKLIPWDPGNVDMLLNILDSLKTGIEDIAGGGAGEVVGGEVMASFIREVLENQLGSSGKETQEQSPVPAPKKAPAKTKTKPPAAKAKPAPEAATKKTPAAELKEVKPTAGKAPTKKAVEEVTKPTNLESTTQIAKEKLAEAKKKADPKSKAVQRDIRVSLDKLDTLINLVGELVTAESMVTRNPDLDGLELENFERAAHHLHRITTDLQDVALAVRMIPVSTTFRKMIRLVHDVSQKSGKKVDLELVGEGTEVDKTVIERIADPLVHIIRNSIDHGLEAPEERSEIGKQQRGKVTLSARHETGEVWIEIIDDGRGLNRDRILAKAIEKGLVTGDGSEMTDDEIYNMVFAPGFSTADEVTDLSGRGVGMDVVRRNIEELKGRVDVHSVPGEGTKVILRIPLTLAIVEGMLLRVSHNQYIIPLLSIRETIRPKKSDITTTPAGDEVVQIRDELLPVVRLHEQFKVNPDYRNLDEGILIVIKSHKDTVCVFADEVLGQYQTVVKGLSDYMGSVRGVSGCSILGDGSICLIMDVVTLIEKAKEKIAGVAELQEAVVAG